MRTLIVALLLGVSTLATAASQRALEKAVNDDQLLAAAGVEPERAEVRTTCSDARRSTIHLSSPVPFC